MNLSVPTNFDQIPTTKDENFVLYEGHDTRHVPPYTVTVAMGRHESGVPGLWSLAVATTHASANEQKRYIPHPRHHINDDAPHMYTKRREREEYPRRKPGRRQKAGRSRIKTTIVYGARVYPNSM